jgi:hypothetical protein
VLCVNLSSAFLFNKFWVLTRLYWMGGGGANNSLHKQATSVQAAFCLLCLLFITHSLTFVAYWLVYVPPGLTFNNSTFCPHSVFMCFVWISEQTAIVSLYSINWLVCIAETESVYCAVRTVFMCFVWISEQTAIVSLYNINWLVCITETECVYCAVRTEYWNILQVIHRTGHKIPQLLLGFLMATT